MSIKGMPAWDPGLNTAGSERAARCRRISVQSAQHVIWNRLQRGLVPVRLLIRGKDLDTSDVERGEP